MSRRNVRIFIRLIPPIWLHFQILEKEIQNSLEGTSLEDHFKHLFANGEPDDSDSEDEVWEDDWDEDMEM